jgi:pimeloyl-ACP methyl ester carboxylesterase
MDGFNKKTIKVSRGFTYTYYVSTNKVETSLPPLLFCHGWPDDAHLWEKIAGYLHSLPFKLIIPDLLGYAGTDKPTDPSAYKFDAVSKDLTEITDAESAPKVVVVGHDWGSLVAARYYNFYPERVSGMVLLNVAYLPPSKDKFDLDAVNAMTAQGFGYPIYSYWYFFTSPEAPAMLKENAARLYAALHAKGETSMKDFFTVQNAFPDYLQSGSAEPEVREYAQDPAFKQYSINRLSRDGFEGAQQYYVAMRNNIQLEPDSQIPLEHYVVNVPFL